MNFKLYICSFWINALIDWIDWIDWCTHKNLQVYILLDDSGNQSESTCRCKYLYWVELWLLSGGFWQVVFRTCWVWKAHNPALGRRWTLAKEARFAEMPRQEPCRRIALPGGWSAHSPQRGRPHGPKNSILYVRHTVDENWRFSLPP